MSPVTRPTGQRPPNKPSSGGNSGATIAIIVLLLLAGGGGAAYYFFFSKQKVKPAPKPASIEQVIEQPQDTLFADTIPLPEPEPVIEPVIEEPTTALPLKYESSPTIEKGFYIIVGSYQNKYNADKLAKNLKADIETRVLYFEASGLYRVAAGGRYGSIHEAYNDRISIRDIPGCAEAWVVENR
jgi:hypothetical protein